MFTGIIETLGTITDIIPKDSNIDLWMETAITQELKIDQSVAHNGICLTVVEILNNKYRVTAVAETITKTNLGNWKVSDKINIERALKVGERLDGHFVQAHVDATGECISKENANGSWLFHFSFPQEFAGLMIEKGSICINGVSLTAFNVRENNFTVTVIPYTYEQTNFHQLKETEKVNLEFDVFGKYFLRQQHLSRK